VTKSLITTFTLVFSKAISNLFPSINHFIIGQAIFNGLAKVIKKMKKAIS